MNALAEDQLWRLRSLLAGTGIPFGMYVGRHRSVRPTSPVSTCLSAHRGPTTRRYLPRCGARNGRSHLPARRSLSREYAQGGAPAADPPHQRQTARTPPHAPARCRTLCWARLDFLVFDEAHTFSGAHGAETACLIRRLRSFCGRAAQDTVCIATPQPSLTGRTLRLPVTLLQDSSECQGPKWRLSAKPTSPRCGQMVALCLLCQPRTPTRFCKPASRL